MTHPKFAVGYLVLAGALGLSFSACSSSPKQQAKQDKIELSAHAPTVVTARAEPGTVILNGELQPMNPAQVLAEVKDFKSNVVSTHLKFADVPLDVPMENIGGTTWRAELTPQELQMLAVSGKTATYKANVIAKNAQGDVSEGKSVTVAVKSPDLQNQYQYG